MKRLTTLICLLALCGFGLTGCESAGKAWDSTWSSTKDVYKEYINPDPEVDLGMKDWTNTEEKVAALFTPVDRPIQELALFLNRQDRFPGEAWEEDLFKRFPWISGMEVVGLDGDVFLKRPESSMKPLVFEPVLEQGEELRDRRLRSHVDMNPLGPEVYLATGMFKGNDIAGAIFVHFDLRSVLDFCPNPGELVILNPEHVVWSGADKQVAEQLHAEPWAEILADEVEGEIEAGERSFVWMTRYLGDRQLVYLTEKAEEDTDDSFFFGLF